MAKTNLLESIKELVNNVFTTVVDLKKSMTDIKARLTRIEKTLKALSVDNAVVIPDEEPEVVKEVAPSKKSSKKSAKKSEDSEVVERIYVHALQRLEGDDFTKVYALVKKHNGKIKNSGRKDKDGKKLACWTFSVEDAVAFGKEVKESKVFGKRDMTKILKSETVYIEKK